MPTTGVVGHTWRADVTATGTIEPWDGGPALDWYVAADDRWHDPKTDSGVRHVRVDGTAVFETKVRIPGGDAVQRVWSVADHGGYTLVEVHNDSSLPIAVAFTRPDVVANRPPATVPIEGIELPAGSVLLPVGHRSTVVVGLSHAGNEQRTLPGALPSSEAVARGWIARTDTASRLELPDAGLGEAVRATRCEALLTGPPEAEVDPERYLLTVAELVRMRELDARDVVAIVEDVASAVEAVAQRAAPLAQPALGAAGVILAAAGEKRALRDLANLVRETERRARPDPSPEGIEVVADVEGRIAQGPDLFPDGIPPSWLGTDFEAHGLVVGPASRLSLAVRWHGPNAAVLWEVDGDPVTLTTGVAADGWASSEPRGEALWVLEPAGARDAISFS